MRKALRSTALLAAIALAGCGSEPGNQAESSDLSSADKVETIASTLQACSYDGEPIEAAPAALTGAAPGDCASAVDRIMGYTGLPANFVVASGPVPNAAAVILLDQNRVPRRVIAFNPDFMQSAARQVGGSEWGAMSVMAHEIAHHLSGHTITPGGSRPEIELEADKFSGFVLYKMGAPLASATQMILTVGTDHATATHPDKRQRANAIREGWVQSCRQSGGGACTSGELAPARQRTPVASSTPAASRAALPAPGSIPFK